MSAIKVTLTPEQHLEAATIGFNRQANAIRKALTSRHASICAWEAHIEGACTELAASIVTGLPWTGRDVLHTPGQPRYTGPDIGERTEVRWSRPSKWEPRLRFSPESDHDDRFYVLVSGWTPAFTVYGYVLGVEARELGTPHEYPDRTVLYVQASKLRPIVPGTVT